MLIDQEQRGEDEKDGEEKGWADERQQGNGNDQEEDKVEIEEFEEVGDEEEAVEMDNTDEKDAKQALQGGRMGWTEMEKVKVVFFFQKQLSF